MPETSKMDRNLALEAVRVTEAAALSASRLMGRGDEKAAGQDTAAKEVFGCFESHQTRCTQPWRIVKWDTAAIGVARGTMQG